MTIYKEPIDSYRVYEAEHYTLHDFISRPSDNCIVLRANDEIFKGKKAIASQTCCGSALRYVTLPSNIEYIGQSAFSSNEDLVEFEAQEGLQIIGRYAFADCSMLRKVILPKSLRSLGKHAFKKCYQLSEIVIPPYVNVLPDIENNPFVSCPRLEKIECNIALKELMIEYSAYLPSLKKMILTDDEGNKVMALVCAERKYPSDNIGMKKNFREVYLNSKQQDQLFQDDVDLTI